MTYRDKLDRYRDNESLWKQSGFGYNGITAKETRLGTLKTEYPFIRYVTVCQSQSGSTPEPSSEASEPYLPQRRIASGKARTAYRDNDTSVTRSPATKKAGRLDAYGAARQAAA